MWAMIMMIMMVELMTWILVMRLMVTKQGRRIWQAGSQGRNLSGDPPPSSIILIKMMLARMKTMMRMAMIKITSSTMWTVAKTTQ